MEDNHPTVIPPLPEYPVEHTTAFDEVQAVDLRLIQYGFTQLARAWQMADSVDAICKLNLVMCKMLKERRDLLLMPREATTSNRKGDVVWPVD